MVKTEVIDKDVEYWIPNNVTDMAADSIQHRPIPSLKSMNLIFLKIFPVFVCIIFVNYRMFKTSKIPPDFEDNKSGDLPHWQ